MCGVIFPTSKHITTDDFSNHKMMELKCEMVTAWLWNIQLFDSQCSRALLMLETVCGNHCSMGWPWERKNCIISFAPMSCMVPTLAQLAFWSVPFCQPLTTARTIACSLLLPGDLSRKNTCSAVFIGALRNWNSVSVKSLCTLA